MKKIVLTQNQVAFVDDENFERLNRYKWCANKKGNTFPCSKRSQFRFEKEQIAKMPKVAGLKVGDAVSISGIGKVISVRMSERRGSQDDHSVEIQLEEVGVSSKKDLKDMDMKEYRKARGEGRGH